MRALAFTRRKLGSNQQGKEAKHLEMNFLKAALFVAVLASALTLGACAQKKESMSTSTSAGTTRTYSK